MLRRRAPAEALTRRLQLLENYELITMALYNTVQCNSDMNKRKT
jgi:hypothetical protein